MLKIILFATMLSGCSALFMERPSGHSNSCERTYALPVLDSGATLAIASMAALSPAYTSGKTQTTVIGTALIVGIVELASAANGFHDASACRSR